MKKTICLVLVASLFFSCNKLKDYLPKPHDSLPEFNNVYGGTKLDGATSIATSPDGGYMIAGYTYSNDGDVSGNHGSQFSDAWVVKLDKSGNKEWQNVFGGSVYDEFASITASPEGGYVLAGTTSSNDGNITGNHGAYDGWVVKLDASGKMLWQKLLGGSSDDEAWDIIVSADGGYIVVGATRSNDGDMRGNHGFEDAWIMKLDKNGATVWQKILGGAGNDYATAITASLDGGFVITGLINEGADEFGNFGNNNVLVVKLDQNGNIVWQKALGRSGAEIAKSIATSSDGGFAIAGWFESASFDTLDVFVMKVDKGGNLKWEKTLGGTSTDYGNAVAATRDGSILMAGSTDSNDGDVSGIHGGGDAWLVKLDTDGNIKWQKALGGAPYAEVANAILTRSDGSFVMAGWAASNDGDLSGKQVDGHGDAWVITISDK